MFLKHIWRLKAIFSGRVTPATSAFPGGFLFKDDVGGGRQKREEEKGRAWQEGLGFPSDLKKQKKGKKKEGFMAETAVIACHNLQEWNNQIQASIASKKLVRSTFSSVGPFFSFSSFPLFVPLYRALRFACVLPVGNVF